MQHHDAMTGTHPKKTGDDYELMMNQTKKDVLKPELEGQVVEEVRTHAKQHGIDISSVTPCDLDGWFAIDCLQDLTPGSERIISVHNPNIKAQDGLIIKVKRELSNIRVDQYQSDPKTESRRQTKPVVTETLCHEQGNRRRMLLNFKNGNQNCKFSSMPKHFSLNIKSFLLQIPMTTFQIAKTCR